MIGLVLSFFKEQQQQQQQQTWIIVALTFVLTAAYVMKIGPWIRQYRHSLKILLALPGTNPSSPSFHPWLGDVHKVLSLPRVPKRPEYQDTIPYLTNKMLDHVDDGMCRLWILSPFRLPFLSECAIAIFNPDLIEDVIGYDAVGLYEKGSTYATAGPLVAHSLLMEHDGPQWKKQRRISAPGFNPAVLQNVTETAANLLYTLLFPKWDQLSSPNEYGNTTGSKEGGGGLPVDVADSMARFAVDVLGRVAFSCDFGALQCMTTPHNDTNGNTTNQTKTNPWEKSAPLFQTYNYIVRVITLRLRYPLRKIIPRMEHYRLWQASKTLNSAINNIISDRLAQLDNTNNDDNNKQQQKQHSAKTPRMHKDLLSQMLSKDENGMRLDREKILGNVRFFIFAGHDTTAATLSFAIWHLAANPDLCRRLQDEVKDVFQTKAQQKDTSQTPYPTYEQLRRLHLLNAIMNETLRLYSAAPIGRRPKRDVTIGGKNGQKQYVIPAGAEIIIFPHYMNRNHMLWDNPMAFDPDRFLINNAQRTKTTTTTTSSSETMIREGSLHNYNHNHDDNKKPRPFIPFSIAPRSCIGKELAMAEIRTTLAHIVHNYDLSLRDPKEKIHAFFQLTIKPNETKVILKKRHHV